MHEEEGTVRVGFGDFLEEGEERDGGVEKAGGVCLERGGREGGCRVAEFVDGRFRWKIGRRRWGGGGRGFLLAVSRDWRWSGRVRGGACRGILLAWRWGVGGVNVAEVEEAV